MTPIRRCCWFFVLASTLTTIIAAETAPPQIQWQRTYGGTNDEWLATILPTSDGGFLLGGTSSSAPSGNKTSSAYGNADMWIVKIDVSGNKVWETSFGGIGDDILSDIKQTADGGFIIGGFSSSSVSGNKLAANYGQNDYWVVRLDSNGQKLWDKSFGSTGDDQLFSVLQRTDGGFLLSGSAESGVSGNKTNAGFGSLDLWLVALDSGGNKIWEKSYGGTSGESFGACIPTSDGGYLLGGRSYSGASGNKTSGNFGSQDYWIVKLDPDGQIVWDRSFGGDDVEELWSIRQVSDGGFLLAGWSQSFPSGNKTSPNFYGGFGVFSDYWLVKIDSNGDKIWDRSFGGTYVDTLFNAEQTANGYVLAGASLSDPSGNKTNINQGSWDWWLVKADLNGNKNWEAEFGGNDSDTLMAVAVLETGYILAGSSSSPPSGNKTAPNLGGSDFWVIKLAGPPKILTQPQDQNIPVGDPAAFSIVAQGEAPLAYQWFFGNSVIRGATNSTLSLFNTTYSQAGLYSVIVSNSFGAVTSTVARLSFNFLTLQMYAGLTIDGQMGQNYRIEYIEAINQATNWQVLTNVTLSSTPYLFIDVDSPKSPVRFYRALLLQ
jgi:hypothetical protein